MSRNDLVVRKQTLPAAPASLGPTMPEDATGAWQAVRPPARRGIRLLTLFAICFGSWSCLAMLDGGAIAPGVVSPDGNKKTVQHLEGGIIARLNVREGDTVEAGQPVIELESMQPRASFDILNQDHRTQQATRVRLEAEKANAQRLEFPREMTQSADDETRRILDDQRHLFASRKTFHEAKRLVLMQRKTLLAEQIRGIQFQVDSASQQLALIGDELKGKQHLHDLKLLPKPELLKLERAKAEIFGKRGEYIATIARAREQIGETDLQLVALEAERSQQIADQLDQVRAKLAEVEQKLQASRDVLQRTVIKAPVSGRVLNLKFKNEGGVVMRGEPIMDIVPSEDTLLIDARVSPTDIDVVRVGLPAVVHLTAYNNRGTPKVPGIVKTVSADRVLDEVTKQPYFLARVAVDKADVERLSPRVELMPGMPAEALIVTERRTFMRYVLQPFLDAWRRSFREV